MIVALIITLIVTIISNGFNIRTSWVKMGWVGLGHRIFDLPNVGLGTCFRQPNQPNNPLGQGNPSGRPYRTGTLMKYITSHLVPSVSSFRETFLYIAPLADSAQSYPKSLLRALKRENKKGKTLIMRSLIAIMYRYSIFIAHGWWFQVIVKTKWLVG